MTNRSSASVVKPQAEFNRLTDMYNSVYFPTAGVVDVTFLLTNVQPGLLSVTTDVLHAWKI